jgi:hypothetical protein
MELALFENLTPVQIAERTGMPPDPRQASHPGGLRHLRAR